MRRVTANTALRLSLYFGNSPEFWMNLQTHYDLKIARRNLDAQKTSSASWMNAQPKAARRGRLQLC
ncbi:HigA family addiction module antitoxin [Bradyrhizobium sp.]|uniref:HigA family addiction module antitoxin n=1 Tax=Bradyrhizobium sp. TaxID=376 RepID=UPI0039C88178